MLANISFKIKLLSLLVTATIGFIIVTIVAMQGLSSQQVANDQVRTLSKIQASNDALSIQMLEITDELQDVKDDTYQEYLGKIDAQIESNEAVVNENLARTKSEDLKVALENAHAQLIEFSNTLRLLLEKRHIIGFDSNSGLRGAIDQMGTQFSQDIESLSLLKREFTNVRKAEASYLFDPTDENFEEFDTSFSRLDTRIENFGFQDKYGVAAKAYYDALVKYGQESLALNSVENIFQEKKALYSDAQMAANKLVEDKVIAAEESAESNSTQANITLLGVSILVTLLSILMMMSIGRSVNNTLKRIINDLSKVKKGDMTAKAVVNTRRNDEFDMLGQSLNEMTHDLNDVLKDVVSTTSSVSNMSNDLDSALGDITSNNRSANQRTQSLANATDEISSRITQLSNTTETLKTHSNETYESAKAGASTIGIVLNSLEDTIKVVNMTNEQLDELGRLSSDIDNVIGMINDLANQTNLLALNAAIEAARAGEAGRGFSVVADEVRSLAEKTVDATSKITDIVGTIQSSTRIAISTMESGQNNLKVIEENGGRAGQAMRDIERNAMTGANSAESMAEAIQDVATTAVEMSTEMEQIAQQLNEDTHSIDILVEKTQLIQNMIKQLSGKTQVFILN